MTKLFVLLALTFAGPSFAAVDRDVSGACPPDFRPLGDLCVDQVAVFDLELCNATLYLRLWSEHHDRHSAREACTLAAKSWTVNDYDTDCNVRYDTDRRRWTSLWWYPYQEFTGLTVKGVNNQVSDVIAPLMSKKYYYETEVRYVNCGRRNTL